MDNNIQIFEHEDFREIRTIEIDGKIYFVGLDVAKALGYKNPWDAMSKHVEKEDKVKLAINLANCEGNTKRGNPLRTIINESGLYSLVLASKLPSAKKFKRWVTSEVLPTIRKTGSYSMTPKD